MPLNFPEDDTFSAGGGGKYLKLNKLKEDPKDKVKRVRGRVLDGFLIGSEAWTVDDKVYRKPTAAEVLDAIEADGKELRVEDGRKNPKPFFACVWGNVTEKKVQLLVGTQGTIIGQIKSLNKDAEWGDGGDYDVNIERGLDSKGFVTYTVKPCKPTPLDATVAAEWEAIKAEWVGLDALFMGGDPFEPFGGK